MNKRIADLRTTCTCLDEAETLLREIALATCDIEAARAKAEKKIAAIKKQLQDETAFDASTIKQLEAKLCAFIDANRELFEKPRKHKCDWGTFGLQKVSEVVVNDKKALIEFARENDFFDLYITSTAPFKKAIEAMLRDRGKVPGCFLVEGNTAVYTVAKALIDEAKESA